MGRSTMLAAYEVVLLGNSNVGKSSLLSRYIHDQVPAISQPTLGVEFLVKTISTPYLNVKLKIWDTTGQKREIVRKHYTYFQGALLVYDIHNRESYDAVKDWVKELKARKFTSTVLGLVGHKADDPDCRAVTTEEALKYAEENNLMFWETSSITNCNINRCFLDVAIAMKRAEFCRCFTKLLSKSRSLWYL